MKSILFSLIVWVSTGSLQLLADHNSGSCVERLESIGVSWNDSNKECRWAGYNEDSMSYCALELFHRGVRGDHAVRECQNQGYRASQFTWCVINQVNHGVRTDIAVRNCR